MAKEGFGCSFLLMVMAMAPCWLMAEGHNITAILENFPDYNVHNRYMTETKVADEVNSRQTVTCLVLSNSVMSTLAADHPLSELKNALRLLVLLDYFDFQKLHALGAHTTTTTTLYQTTGEAVGQQGFVNITELPDDRVLFGSASPGSKLASEFIKSVRQLPYNISVLEISAPILFPGIFDGSSAADANLTSLLEKAGCKRFASLISTSGIANYFRSAMDRGFTLLSPNDDAFNAKGVPDLASLSIADLVTLLQYHAIATYAPKETLKLTDHPLATMASGAPGNYELTVSTQGDDVLLHTGLDSSRIASTVLDEIPVCILTVESVLLPPELFGKPSSPAPAPRTTVIPPSPPPASDSPEQVPSPATAKSPGTAKPPSTVDVPPPEPLVPAPSESPEDYADQGNDGLPSGAAKVVWFSVMMTTSTVAGFLVIL